MKKILLSLCCIPFALQAQFDTLPAKPKPKTQPWRTLTFSYVTGIDQNSRVLKTYTTNLYYELDNGLAITNWTGLQARTSTMNGWLSSQTLIIKSRSNGFSYGAGLQYGNAAPTLVPDNSSLFGVVRLSYQIRLK